MADNWTVQPHLHDNAAMPTVSDAVPSTVTATVHTPPRKNPPKRVKNPTLRPREYLTEAEVQKLIQVARHRGRHGVRNAAMILMAYRHGLRVSELSALRWDQIDFAQGMLYLGRPRNGVHTLCGEELQLQRQIKRNSALGPRVFVTERDGPMSTAGFRKLLARTGCAAGFGFGVHPHMLRPACGYKLANDGQDTRAIQHYLGHKNIQHTVRYTQLSAKYSKGFWHD